MPASHPLRNLTIDEKKAAEAAFRGDPFNPAWSPAAHSIYDGILKAMGPRSALIEPSLTDAAATVQTKQEGDAPQAPVLTREEAIQAGYLIDVTPIAHSVGLPMPVCISKPLWDLGITASRAVPDDQYEPRVRDVLMALRLRLANTRIASPYIEFRALLAFPPEPVPQLCSLHAIAYGDSTAPFSLIVLLSKEVSAAIQPPTNN